MGEVACTDKESFMVKVDGSFFVSVLLFTADFDNQTIFYIAHPVRCAINLHKNIGLIL